MGPCPPQQPQATHRCPLLRPTRDSALHLHEEHGSPHRLLLCGLKGKGIYAWYFSVED